MVIESICSLDRLRRVTPPGLYHIHCELYRVTYYGLGGGLFQRHTIEGFDRLWEL